MLQDYRLGLRMLLKYPGLTLAGGLALAIAIGIGAGWYDVVGKVFAPTIPLPEGERLVSIETRLSLGAHDIERVHGDISLRLAKGDEYFVPLGWSITLSVNCLLR